MCQSPAPKAEGQGHTGSAWGMNEHLSSQLDLASKEVAISIPARGQ